MGVLKKADLAAGIADTGIGEGADERADSVGLPQRVGIGERDDLTASAAYGGVLRADLATARQLQYDVGARLPGSLGRRVRAPVTRHDQLQQLSRVVERERVLDLGGNHRLLIVCGDDQGQGRERGRGWLGGGPGEPSKNGERQGIAELGPHNQRGGQPEEDLQDSRHREGFSLRSDL